MKAKIYKIAAQEYRQEIMSVDQIKLMAKLLKELGVAQMIEAEQFNLNQSLDQIIEHDKIEEFLAIVLIPKQQDFDKKKYNENLQTFGVCTGDLLAEVWEDFLSFNEPWFARLNKPADKLPAPAAKSAGKSTSMN